MSRDFGSALIPSPRALIVLLSMKFSVALLSKSARVLTVWCHMYTRTSIVIESFLILYIVATVEQAVFTVRHCKNPRPLCGCQGMCSTLLHPFLLRSSQSAEHG